MRILFVLYDDGFNGGAVGILRQIIDYYLDRNNEIHILFLKKRRLCQWESLSRNNLFLHYGGLNLFKSIILLRKIHFDYCYSSVVKLNALTGLFKRIGLLHLNKVVVRESTSIFKRFKGFKLSYYRFLYRIGYPGVDIIICQTSEMKSQLLEDQSWLDKVANVLVIANPVNVDLMRDKAKEKMDLSKYIPYIVTAGRFIPEKGYDLLLTSFAKIKLRHPELNLLFLGDGVLRPQLEKQIKDLEIQNSVFLVGQVNNVYPWFQKAKACVVSSRIEGFPNVLLQMMSQNNCVISTLCAGDIDTIEGLHVCPPNSVDALTASIEEALCQQNSEKNRKSFDAELQRRSIESFIQKIR